MEIEGLVARAHSGRAKQDKERRKKTAPQQGKIKWTFIFTFKKYYGFF